jgi:hypothetical protein
MRQSMPDFKKSSVIYLSQFLSVIIHDTLCLDSGCVTIVIFSLIKYCDALLTMNKCQLDCQKYY